MKVLIPTPSYGSPAALALRMEGVDYLETLCFTPHSYGAIFDFHWTEGEPFLICEHDIVAFPGAVQELAECGSPWCLRRYPLGVGNVAQAFGFAKYAPEGPAPENWKRTEWQQLDGQVIPHLRKLFGKPHVHEPPVAHCREEIPT